jgi:hypothetical protein
VRVYRIPINEIAPTKTLLRAPDKPSPVALPFNTRGGQELYSVAGQTLRSPRSLPSDSATRVFCSFWQEQTIAQAPATVIVIDDDLGVRQVSYDLASACFYCYLADADVVGELLVEVAGQHQGHYLAFAEREGLKPRA